ncbi:MAG: condensation domain-containing protein, partial [Deltaproteobacteria bacterium]
DDQLSEGQKALWFLHELAPESSGYNVARAVRVRTAVDAAALRRAFEQLLERHVLLRASFVNNGGSPVIAYGELPATWFEHIDGSRLTREDFEERLRSDANAPFDLAAGPLFRIRLYQTARRDEVLLLAMHHIVTDFWSLGVMVQELATLYSAARFGLPHDLPPVESTYAEFVRWQSAMLASSEGERHRAYWHKQLDGPLPALALCTDRPRPALQTFNGAVRTLTVSPDLAGELRKFSQSRNTTLFVTLLTSFYALLQRTTGQNDIVVGIPTTGRVRPKTSGVVGYFVNPIALRARFDGDVAFDALEDLVRETLLEGLEHQAYPFVRLVEEVQRDRDPSRSPVFQVSFVLQQSQNAGVGSLGALAVEDDEVSVELGDLRVSAVRIERRAAIFDLAVMIAEADDALTCTFEYNTDLFDADTIGRLASRYQRVLSAVVTSPTLRVGELSLLEESERAQIATWNATERQYPTGTVHGLIEQQARRTPDEIAVEDESRAVTYAELDRESNQLAHWLRENGVGRRTLVGVCLERSVEMVVSLLAVLKAGAGYVPIDPTYPGDRLRYMFEDSGVVLALTQGALLERVTSAGAKALAVDQERAALSRRPATSV